MAILSILIFIAVYMYAFRDVFFLVVNPKQKTVYSYYSDNLDINRFDKNNSSDEKHEAYVRNQLDKVRTKDFEILPNLLNQRFIVLNSFNEFSDFDKDTFEALAINAIKNRKALQLGPIENQTLRQYLSK